MENIFDNFANFLNFSSELILKCRGSQLPPNEIVPLKDFHLKDHLENPADAKNQLFVIEFFLSEKTSKNNKYLIEQWIFDFHLDKVPQRVVKIVKNEQEFNIAFISIIKSLSSLLVNLPLYKEYLNKNSKYSSQIAHDFSLSHKIIRKPTEISNFQGWNSQKWNQFYSKFPQEDEFSFYVSSPNSSFKFSFQLNFFKNVYDLYKVVDPIKQNIERNRIRSISEQITKEISQYKQNVSLINYDSQPSNEFIQWLSKNSISFNDSLDENIMGSLTPKSLSTLKNERDNSPKFNFHNYELSPRYNENNAFDPYWNYNKSVYKGLLHSIKKNANYDGTLDHNPDKNEGAFISLIGNGVCISKDAINNGNKLESKDESLVILIEAIEKKKKKIVKCLGVKGNQTIGELVNEFKQFNEQIDKGGK